MFVCKTVDWIFLLLLRRFRGGVGSSVRSIVRTLPQRIPRNSVCRQQLHLVVTGYFTHASVVSGTLAVLTASLCSAHIIHIA